MLLLCAGSGLLLLPVHFCTPPLWLLPFWQAHPAPLLSAPTPSARWAGTSPRPLCRA